MRYIFLSLICLSAVTFNSCNVINPVEDTPTYIHLDSFNFTVNDPLLEGTASQKVTSAWVYFNNEAVGVFELPATIPIIAKTDGQVRVAPGIAVNGLSNQGQYPFFMADTFTIKRSEGQVLYPVPNITYVSGLKFPFKENFETGNAFTKFNPNVTTDTSIVQTSDPSKVFEGGRAGYLYMDASHPTSENITSQGFPITQGQAFLEINYKCNTSFQIGLLGNGQTTLVPQYQAGIKPRETWNKVYVNLAPFTAANKSSQYFVMIKSGLDEGLTTGYVLIDNIKVVSF